MLRERSIIPKSSAPTNLNLYFSLAEQPDINHGFILQTLTPAVVLQWRSSVEVDDLSQNATDLGGRNSKIRGRVGVSIAFCIESIGSPVEFETILVHATPALRSQ